MNIRQNSIKTFPTTQFQPLHIVCTQSLITLLQNVFKPDRLHNVTLENSLSSTQNIYHAHDELETTAVAAQRNYYYIHPGHGSIIATPSLSTNDVKQLVQIGIPNQTIPTYILLYPLVTRHLIAPS